MRYTYAQRCQPLRIAVSVASAISTDQDSDTGPLKHCVAMTQQQTLLHKLPSELLGTIIDAVQGIEDLLRLSTSCQLLRNTVTGSFWQCVLDERYKVIELTSKPRKNNLHPRKQVVQRVDLLRL